MLQTNLFRWGRRTGTCTVRKPTSSSPDGCVLVPRLGLHLVLCLGQEWPLTPLLVPLPCHPISEPRSLSPKIHSTISKYPKFNNFVLLLPLLLPVFLSSELLPGQEQVTQHSGTVLPGQLFLDPHPAPALYCHTENSSHPRLPPACDGRAWGGSTITMIPGYCAISKRKVAPWNDAALCEEAEMV